MPSPHYSPFQRQSGAGPSPASAPAEDEKRTTEWEDHTEAAMNRSCGSYTIGAILRTRGRGGLSTTAATLKGTMFQMRQLSLENERRRARIAIGER